MRKNCSLPAMTVALVLWLMSNVCWGQPKAGHFIYNLISYEIIDSSEMNVSDIPGMLDYMKDKFYAEVYFNPEWVVVLQKQTGGSIKRMYNRKSRVLYKYYVGTFYDGKTSDGSQVKKVTIDSIQALKRKDKKLLDAIDTLKSDLQVKEYQEDTKRIHGYPCHRVTITGFRTPPTVDEIWVAKFANVPDLIYPDAYYFLLEGVPLEFIEDMGDIKFKWGVVDILPARADDAIFKQDHDGYEVLVDDTPKLIYEGIHFIRTYQPKSE